MPGVPSGLGCNGCRSGKKKCDQLKPSCSRCQRLKIECIGAGQRRFKFVNPTFRTQTSSTSEVSSNSSDRSRTLSRSVTPRKCEYQISDRLIRIIPGNETSQLASNITMAIDATMDDRFSLMGSYGPFLRHIPSRLGKNMALDAAVESLVVSHANLCRGSAVTPAVLSTYAKALTQMRLTLDDPSACQSTETLCAAWILLITQGIAGGSNCSASGHVNGMARILKYRGSMYYNSGDELEAEVMMTIRGPIVFAALSHDTTEFDDTDWYQLVERPGMSEAVSLFPGTRIMSCMARMPLLLRRGRVWRKNNAAEPQLVGDIISIYETVVLVRGKMLDALDKLQQRFTAGEIDYKVFSQAYSIYARTYVFSLSVVCLFGTMVSAVSSDYVGLAREMYDCTVEILEYAQKLSRYRPLGASLIPLALTLCWAATSDQEQRVVIESTIGVYMEDYPSLDTGEELLEGLQTLERRLKLL